MLQRCEVDGKINYKAENLREAVIIKENIETLDASKLTHEFNAKKKHI